MELEVIDDFYEKEAISEIKKQIELERILYEKNKSIGLKGTDFEVDFSKNEKNEKNELKELLQKKNIKNIFIGATFVENNENEICLWGIKEISKVEKKNNSSSAGKEKNDFNYITEVLKQTVVSLSDEMMPIIEKIKDNGIINSNNLGLF